jgi:pyruvate carboxylase subunit B
MNLTNNNTPVKITDLTLRDGHQSLLATRGRTEDLVAIASDMDKVGFWSMEVWGGATFDVMTRFLNEDPWERIRLLKKLLPNTKLQMLLRGQNLVGYRHYADDVVTAFVHHAADCGIDVFRVFDAVNDERNFETSFKAIKDRKKHIQGTLSYSLTERKLGGPVYTVDYYVNKAIKLQEMGADSLCIKDMAGLLAPDDAYKLIKALKEALTIPVSLHSHFTSGMADMSMLKAIEAGVDIVDTCLAPFALRTSHPAIEPLVVSLSGTPRDTGIKLDKLLKLGTYFESIAPKYRDFMAQTRMSVIDTGVLSHQIPGGMFSNMVSQLREANALDKIEEVYKELPRTREELGNPPLVTPTSQILGTQAISNVLFGRYKVISQQVKDYVYGLYGKAPMPIDPKVQKLVLKGYDRGDKPITCRPADVLEPEMDKAKEATKDIAKDIGDVLVYTLYPTTGMRFLKWKYGLEEPPAETKAKTLEDIHREDEIVAKAKAGELVDKSEVKVVAAPANIGLDVFIDGKSHRVEISLGSGSTMMAASPKGTPSTPSDGKGEAIKADEIPSNAISVAAPMPGTIIRYLVEKGNKVEPGGGEIIAVNYSAGDKVNIDDVLAVIG